MTDQELYDKVRKTLLGQGGCSMGADGECAYRGSNGRVCAAGALIADEFYHESLEGKNVCVVSVQAALEKSGVIGGQLALVHTLQKAHDYAARDAAYSSHDELFLLKERLQKTATEYGLTP